MKVALFGGTFDPVHKGHVNAAKEILRQGLVDEVWFIPVCWHAFKENGNVSLIDHRKKMIGLAIQGEKGLKVIDLNGNPTHTFDTILKAKKYFPGNEFFWLMGTNLVEEFSSWSKPKMVLQEAKLILFPVPGSEHEKNSLFNSDNSIIVQAKEIDLSSTIVREKLSKGESIEDLVDEKVLDYIEENRLYSNNA